MNCKIFLTFTFAALIADRVVSLETENIIGGQVVDVSKYPYSASLQVGGEHICTAAFIDDRAVLTAAHCIYGNTTQAQLYDYKIVGGRSNLKKRRGGEQIDVITIYVHGGYRYIKRRGLQIRNDIAVLILASSHSQRNIRLPKRGESFFGNATQIAGWGENIEDDPIDGKLRFIDVDIISPKNCDLPPTPTICARAHDAFNMLQGTCSGDSGGILSFDNKAVGIVSYGPCDESKEPNVYTEVSAFIDFIERAVAGNPIKGTDIVDINAFRKKRNRANSHKVVFN